MKFCLFILFSIQIQYASGQIFADKENDRVFNPKATNRFLISLDNSSAQTITIKGIRTINIMDARADTLALGYLKKSMFRIFNKIEFSTPGLTEMINFSQGIIIPDSINSEYEILLVVKELWLGEEDTDYDSKDKIQDTDEKLFPESYIKATFDFYIKEDDRYYPLYRFDSSMAKTLPLKDYAFDHIQNALQVSINKIAQYNLSNITKTKTALTLSGIQNYNDDRFQLSVLNDSSCKTGIYLSYDEFKANNPSIQEYEIRRGKLGDELYLKSQDGRWVVTRSAWGYCDGKTSYIKSGDNYFGLIRVENSFYFYGSKVIARREVLNNSNNHNYLFNYDYKRNSGGKKRYSNLLSPFKLNIEKGNIY